MLLVPLIAVGLAYVVGYRRLARRRHVQHRRDGLFVVGYATLVVALISPLHSVGEQYFSVHMVQHLLLSLVAPPLVLRNKAPAFVSPPNPEISKVPATITLPRALTPTTL